MLQIRRPTLHDLNDCAQLDASYSTQRVWQLNLRAEENDIQVNFHLVHLPRPITINGTPAADNLLKYWQRGDCMLAARKQHAAIGFLHMISEPPTKSGLIARHIVSPDHRNQGHGSTLLQQALQWGHNHNLRSVCVQVSTKNHPAIAFYLVHGFTFSGFHERFYSDQEIIIELARTIR